MVSIGLYFPIVRQLSLYYGKQVAGLFMAQQLVAVLVIALKGCIKPYKPL
jgi:hypothetical protein